MGFLHIRTSQALSSERYRLTENSKYVECYHSKTNGALAMKKLLLSMFWISLVCLLMGQTYHIQEGFSTTSLPSGWSGDVYFNSTANIGNLSGGNGAGFNATNKYLQVPAVNGAGTLTFWMKGSASSSDISFKVQKAWVGEPSAISQATQNLITLPLPRELSP